MSSKYLKRFAEFLFIGILFNLVDNIIAVRVVSDTIITGAVIQELLLFTIPFAVVSELIVDGKNIFRHRHEK